jgi:hypothetical protein
MKLYCTMLAIWMLDNYLLFNTFKFSLLTLSIKMHRTALFSRNASNLVSFLKLWIFAWTNEDMPLTWTFARHAYFFHLLHLNASNCTTSSMMYAAQRVLSRKAICGANNEWIRSKEKSSHDIKQRNTWWSSRLYQIRYNSNDYSDDFYCFQ